MVVAIDGPAGAGKSTVALELARRLGFAYLDSGALYRAAALLSLRQPQVAPAELAASAIVELLQGQPGTRPQVLLNGDDVTGAIRSPQVSEAASVLAADEAVRRELVAVQRALLSVGDWVAEGRDIGAVVAPDAELKVFLTADPLARARRRAAELGADVEEVLAEQARRDARDEERAHSPLRPAPGAVQLDTTELTAEQAVDALQQLVRRARAAR
jgi:cytidylate kinase